MHASLAAKRIAFHVQKSSRFCVNTSAQRAMGTIVADSIGSLKLTPSEPVSAVGAGEVKVAMKAGSVLVEDVIAMNGFSMVSKGVGAMGSAGSGVVTGVGSGVTDIHVDDSVLVVGTGVWADEVVVKPEAVSIVANATAEEIASLPAFVSAYTILTNYCSTPLQAGDLVVQTHANGAIGAAISAIGKAMGLDVFSITAAKLSDAKLADTLKKKGAVKLAVIGSAGDHVLNIVRSLASGGCAVAYSAECQATSDLQPVSLPISGMIFSNTSVAGFDLTAFASANPSAYREAVKAVMTMAVDSKISLKPGKVFPQAEFATALTEVAKKGTAAILKF